MSERLPDKARAAAPPISISEDELARFCEFFYRKTGIRIETNKRYFVERRLVANAVAAGAGAFSEYFVRLRLDRGPLMEALVNDLTVNETYFWREHYQFECLTGRLLDEIAARKRPGEPIRLWSVPCSTGEEPCGLAIQAPDSWPRADEFDIEILAGDIDSAVLRRAQTGIYEARSVSRLPKPYLKRYFREVSEGRWQVIDDLRQSIDFARINISDAAETARYRRVDVVFRRNLLIYFDDVSRRVAAENLFEAMTPGGFICLGHSESMSRITNLFAPRRLPEALVHQRPLAAG